MLNVDFVGLKPEPHAVVRKFLPTRPERAEAPSPGRALKKSPFLRTKTEKGYDL